MLRKWGALPLARVSRCEVGQVSVGSTGQPQQPVAAAAKGLVLRLGQGAVLPRLFQQTWKGRSSGKGVRLSGV